MRKVHHSPPSATSTTAPGSVVPADAARPKAAARALVDVDAPCPVIRPTTDSDWVEAAGAAVGRLGKPVAAAVLGATLALGAGAPLAAQELSETPLAESILNPRGVGNVSGSSPLFDGMRVEHDRLERPHVDRDNIHADPNRVMTRNHGSSGSQEVRRILTQRIDAPRTAQAIAAKLAELYGPFTADNSEENRRAIIENLRWIGDSGTGVRYDHGRAGGSDTTTQTPNETLSDRSGVCRDTHTALQAVLASLVNARFDGDKWVPGSPSGAEGHVQTLGFATPAEHHAYLVFRDPATGGWDALEYGKSYDLDAPNAIDAFRSLAGYVPGTSAYKIRGWDNKPVVTNWTPVGAQAARDFIKDDPGTGEAGQVRITGGHDHAQLTAFLSQNTAVSGELRASETGRHLDGGIKLNYHEDFETLDRQGYLRIAGGVYTNAFEASDTGRRGAEDRTEYRTYVLGVQVDGRYEGKPQELLGQHLQYKLGADYDMFVGLPFTEDGLVLGAVGAYTNMDVGVDGTLLGQQILSPNLTLDWAVRARYDADLLSAATELMTSEGGYAGSLGADALRTDFALALTHKADSGLITRFEAGGTQKLTAPFDPQTHARSGHHVLLTVAPDSGDVSFGVIARGHTLNGDFVPVDSVGAALRVQPYDNVDFGVSVDAASPNGDLGGFKDDVRILGNVNIRF